MNFRKNEHVRKIAKKGLTFSLCAVLAGGITAGTFGSETFTGWNQKVVQAAINKDDNVTLLKSERAADETEDKQNTAAENRARGGLDVSDIVEEAMPSVVSITTKSVQEVQDIFGMYGFYGFGYGYGNNGGSYEQEVEGRGSGIIIGKNEEQLLVATNYHVVQDANTLTVTFADGESYEAAVRGYDEDRDLAVVAVSFSEIKDDTLDAISIATIGSSDDLKVGEQVVAIGNALGYGQSVTTGIVSAKNRRLDDSTDEDGVNLIQTDAAINPGNSGGALLNMDGEVVGINSSKMASTEVEGMCYAISISDVSDVLEKLMNEVPRNKVEGKHGVLGITGSSVSEEAQSYGIPSGVFVREVTEGGGADNAGIKINYVIVEFDGKAIHSIERLVELLDYYEPGESVDVVIAVPNNGEYEKRTVTVKLGASEDPVKSEEKAPSEKNDDFTEQAPGEFDDDDYDDYREYDDEDGEYDFGGIQSWEDIFGSFPRNRR